jgi:uncharacterized protein
MRRAMRWSAAVCVLAGAGAAHAAGDVVISQVYGGGGNANAPYQNDFVEIFNRSAAPVNIAGWSLQYASATGTGTFGSNFIAALAGTLQPGEYYLVRLASQAAVGAPLPPPDATSNINMSGTAGKVVLVNNATGLACNGGSVPCSPAQLAQMIDLVGFGGANFFEGGAPTAALSAQTAAIRVNSGCTDTDINSADFVVATPTPRNLASPASPCGGPVNAPVVPSCPANLPVALGVGGVANLSASDADGFPISAAITSAPVAGITLPGGASGNPLMAQLQVSPAVAGDAIDARLAATACTRTGCAP